LLRNRNHAICIHISCTAASRPRTFAKSQCTAFLAAVCLAAAALAVPARAADDARSKASAQADSSAPPQIRKKPSGYDIDASATDVRFVLEALARCSGSNIVVSPEITGEVTAHLSQLPVDSIVEFLATVGGFAWQKNGDTYLVAGKDKFEKPPKPEPATPPSPQLLVWECRHVRPADVVAIVRSLFPKITAAEGPAPVAPVLGSSNAGLGSASPAGGTVPPAGYASPSQPSGSGGGSRVVLIGEPDEIVRAKDMLACLDVGRRQVSIRMAITEIDSSAGKEVGIDWTWSDIVLREPAPDSGIKFGKVTREDMSFTGTVSALLKTSGARLLAQPNIAVVDAESADILIGDRILFPKLIGYSQFGTPIFDKDEERVGIYLQIAPRTTGTDQMLLTLYPQVSLVTSFLKTQAGDYPQISTREARTTVSVRNGETLAIGGLLREDEVKNASKIPLLGDLPIIGSLFRHTKTSKQRSEIVILLTPTISEAK